MGIHTHVLHSPTPPCKPYLGVTRLSPSLLVPDFHQVDFEPCDVVLCVLCSYPLCLLCAPCTATRLSSVHQWVGISPDDLSTGGKTALEAVVGIAADLKTKDPSQNRWVLLCAWSPVLGLEWYPKSLCVRAGTYVTLEVEV